MLKKISILIYVKKGGIMKALLLIDIQNDFLPGGSLAVPEGEQIIPLVNRLQKRFDLVVASQDWHPENHGSFAANHPGKEPFDKTELNGLEQILWPPHCVQGLKGAEFSSELDMNKVETIFRKGMDPEIDSYSGFFDNGHQKSTALHDYLQGKHVDTVYIAGLAADVCVRFTASDAVEMGYKTYVISDATRAVGKQEAFEKTRDELEGKGVKFISSASV